MEITQDAELDPDPVAITVRADAPDPILELDVAAPYGVTKAWAIIGEVVDGQILQYLTGHVTLGLEQIDGSVTRWPTMLGGKLAPQPPEP